MYEPDHKTCFPSFFVTLLEGGFRNIVLQVEIYLIQDVVFLQIINFNYKVVTHESEVVHPWC